MNFRKHERGGVLKHKRLSEASNISNALENGHMGRKISAEVIHEDAELTCTSRPSVALINTRPSTSFTSTSLLLPNNRPKDLPETPKSKINSLNCCAKLLVRDKFRMHKKGTEYKPAKIRNSNTQESCDSLLKHNHNDWPSLNQSTLVNQSAISSPTTTVNLLSTSSSQNANTLSLSSTALCLSPSYLAFQIQEELEKNSTTNDSVESTSNYTITNNLNDEIPPKPNLSKNINDGTSKSITFSKKPKSLPLDTDKPVLVKCKYISTPV